VREQVVETGALLRATHFGHDHIREHGLYGFAKALRGFQGFPAILRGKHAIAGGG